MKGALGRAMPGDDRYTCTGSLDGRASQIFRQGMTALAWCLCTYETWEGCEQRICFGVQGRRGHE